MKNISFVLLVILFSCKNDVKNNQQNTQPNKPKEQSIAFVVNSPVFKDTLQIGDSLDISISLTDTTKKLDSLNLIFDAKRIFSGSATIFRIPLIQNKVGRGVLGIEVVYADGDKQRKNVELFFLSDIKPEKINCSLIKKYPHSTENFTEGLVYKDGLMYEGSGDWGKSGLHETNLETGEVLRSTFLSSDIFGEGITILNNKIVQLTYKSQEGYVYNRSTFNLIKKFTYSFSVEGWGLTTDGKDLIMSNGTDRIYTMDSTYYSLIKERQVCDNKEPLDSINELEYVNGIIYANIWMDNRIAKIDYNSGKVLGYIDLSSFVPRGFRNHHSNVLNGIAYNPENGNLFVTGKRWDSIFEIKLEF